MVPPKAPLAELWMLPPSSSHSHKLDTVFTRPPCPTEQHNSKLAQNLFHNYCPGATASWFEQTQATWPTFQTFCKAWCGVDVSQSCSMHTWQDSADQAPPGPKPMLNGSSQWPCWVRGLGSWWTSTSNQNPQNHGMSWPSDNLISGMKGGTNFTLKSLMDAL